MTDCDFSFYFVSRKAMAKIKEATFAPFIELRNHPSLRKHKALSYFLVLRKEMHLIFEAICKRKLIFNQFEKMEHLLAKEIFVSLQNIEEVLNYKLVHLLEEERSRFREHFLNCPVNSPDLFQIDQDLPHLRENGYVCLGNRKNQVPPSLPAIFPYQLLR
jgi:hypothetical protein